MIALKKSKSAKRSDHRTISLAADIAKIVARILRRIGRKTEDVLGEDRFGFKEEEELEMQLGSESNIRMKVCACFIDWRKAFDRAKWTELMQILKRTGTGQK